MNLDNFDHLNVFDRNEAIKASLTFQNRANPILERITELKADQRRRDRLELFKEILPVIIPMQDDLKMSEVIHEALIWTDASLAELDKEKETPDA